MRLAVDCRAHLGFQSAVRIYLVGQRGHEFGQFGEYLAGDLLLVGDRGKDPLVALILLDVGTQPVEHGKFRRGVCRQRVTVLAVADKPGLALRPGNVGLFVPLEVRDHRLYRGARRIEVGVVLTDNRIRESGYLGALVDEPRFGHTPQRRAGRKRELILGFGDSERRLEVDQPLGVGLVGHVRSLRFLPVRLVACPRSQAVGDPCR